MTKEELTEICKLIHPDWTEEKVRKKVETVWEQHLQKKNGAHSTEKNNSRSYLSC